MPLPTPYRRLEFRAHELARVEHSLADCIAAALALVHDTLRPWKVWCLPTMGWMSFSTARPGALTNW